ncbi:MAG: NTP transferase domain-containing protein, partial [Thermoleophilia bacterium]|nr:NTP transferase domain-containing protein [Thermoleophilia bacterium]
MADESESESEIGAGAVLGAVLAGGSGSRIGGAKATVELAGRPLIAYPLAALEAAGVEAVVV